MTLVGVLMHFTVAFWWSAVFLVLVSRVTAVRRLLDSPNGVLKVASVYGPAIWLVMSLAVIPFLVRRPPVINGRCRHLTEHPVDVVDRVRSERLGQHRHEPLDV